jgi:hypothetical protein
MRALIKERWNCLTPEERNLPANALNSPTWPHRFEDECAVELERAADRARSKVERRAPLVP